MPPVPHPVRTRYGALARIRNSLVALTLLAMPVSAAEPVTVLALGDSLTAGYGLPEGDGFVPQLQRWLDARKVPAKVVNAGVSGDTTAGGRARLDWSLSEDVDALIVNLGGNDLLRGIDPAESRRNLEAILAAAGTRGLPVLLVGLRAPANYGSEYQAAFDAIYPDLAAAYGADLVTDFFASLVAQAADPSARQRLMQPDGIHPSALGVAAIVESLGPKVEALVRRAAG